VVPHLVDGELFTLQYANDTILLMDHDLEEARNLNTISIRAIAGFKINFHKSKLFYFDEANLYAKKIGCGLDSFPTSYLGIPIHHRRLTLAEWKLVEERL
jgi:hypothetical protein